MVVDCLWLSAGFAGQDTPLQLILSAVVVSRFVPSRGGGEEKARKSTKANGCRMTIVA